MIVNNPKPLSERSQKQLNTCHPDLVRLFTRVNEVIPCSILEGHRGQAAQDEAFAKGNSKLKWPYGKHNQFPSVAVDALPLPIDWKRVDQMILFAGVVFGIASEMGIKIRWGYDWNQNFNLHDEHGLRDAPHFELVFE